MTMESLHRTTITSRIIQAEIVLAQDNPTRELSSDSIPRNKWLPAHGETKISPNIAAKKPMISATIETTATNNVRIGLPPLTWELVVSHVQASNVSQPAPLFSGDACPT